MQKNFHQKLTRKQKIQVGFVFVAFFLLSSLVVWLLEKESKNGSHFELLQIQILIVALVCLLISEIVVKIFQLKNHTALIEAERLTYFEHHLAIDDAVIWAETALDGTITFANSHFCRVSGYSKAELEGQNHRILKSDEHSDDFYQTIWRTISSGKVWRGEICNRAKEGRLYWLNTVIVPIFEPNTKIIKKYIGIRFDITAEKEIEKKATYCQQQLFQMQKLDSIGQLTGGIAHDFNNILMGISGYTTLATMINAKNENVFNQTKMEGYLHGIEKCTETATSLIEQMLVYCREHDVVEPTDIDPSVVIFEHVMEMLRSTISHCIELDFLANETPNIVIDPTQLHQILVNLVINARDAIESSGSQKGAITVGLSFEKFDTHCNAFFGEIKGDFVVISVKDDGMGMEPEKIAHIFDPFFTTKDVGKGTGLGLSVVSGIVGHAGGHIR